VRRRFLWLVCVSVVSVVGGSSNAIAAAEVVIRAADVTVHGNWTKTAGADAAGGIFVSSADLGWSAPNSALAAPADYFEATFIASAQTTYQVWVRMRAANDSKWNDSVWVQFSDSVNVLGAPMYSIASPDALLVNLEPCSNCGVAGWGWTHGAWWVGQTTTVAFATSGAHTIRVQTREDGAQIDQIVLSPATYLVAAPGQAFNDATIVPQPAAPSTSPFSGTPAAVPGTIQAADFDRGGEGVAYHDSTPGNAGGAYRSTNVDIETCTEGGVDVGWLAIGEWLTYSIRVASSGSYMLGARVAAPSTGGTFHVEVDGANATGPIAIPETGSWQIFTTVNTTIALTAGDHQARVVIDAAGPGAVIGNLKSFSFTAAAQTQAPPPPVSASGPTPYGGVAAAIPGTIRAERFDDGGEGVAYHDSTRGNTGGAFRQTDVDIENSVEGLFDVGWIDPGEWLNYTVNVLAAGDYNIDVRIAAPQAGQLHVGFAQPSSVWSAVAIPATGGWQLWSTVRLNATLAAGQQRLTLVFDTGGFNVSSVTVTPAVVVSPPPTPQSPPPPSTNTPTNTPTTNTSGSSSAPQLIVFHASPDNATVTSYVFDVYATAASTTSTPLASLNLGKPATDANGDMTVDASTFMATLSAGSYIGTVTAIGPGGLGQSLAAAFAK